MPLPDNDDLLKLLGDEPVPPPSAERRADALLKANIAFREKMQAKAQAGSFFKRLFGIGPHTLETKMKMRTLMGGSALALVGVLAVSVGYNQYYQQHSTQAGQASFQSLANVRGGAQLSGMIDNTSTKPSLSESIGSLFSGSNEDARATMPVTQAPAAPVPPAYQQAVRPLEQQRAEAAGAPLHDSENIIFSSRTRGEAEARRAPAPGTSSLHLPYDTDKSVTYNESRDSFANLPDNPMQDVARQPVSTFSADVDTASYSAVRRVLQAGQMPPVNAVRTEEMVNYFKYNYPLPETRSQPFAPTVSIVDNPWNKGTQLVHIGIKAFDLPADVRPPVNLVLLVDVSGSMASPDKLGLVKSSFSLLIDQLKPTDTVSIVTYAGYSGVALEPTKVSERDQILRTIQNLNAGGGTAGAEGLRTAYDLARRNYNKEGVNRILLATDGDFNVGVSEPGGLAQYVANQRSSGIFLSVLGYGMGNYQDSTMQALAQNGNGTAAYIDNMSEARRVLAEQASSTLFTVAKDVKFQIEFNPAQVQSYRLLGYETRALQREDFNNDKVDAGEVGAGSQVTAIYEVVPVGAAPAAEQPRYGTPRVEDSPAIVVPPAGSSYSGEIGHLRIRYKLPNSDTSTLIERPIVKDDRVDMEAASADVRFATAVAGFSRLLRHSVDVRNFGYADVRKLAETARGDDVNGERIGFVDLVRIAESISGSQARPGGEGGVAFPPPR